MIAPVTNTYSATLMHQAAVAAPPSALPHVVAAASQFHAASSAQNAVVIAQPPCTRSISIEHKPESSGIIRSAINAAGRFLSGAKQLVGLSDDMALGFARPALAAAGTDISIPQRIEIPTTVFMAKMKKPGRKSPPSAAFRSPRKKRHDPKPELAEDRAAKWLEAKFKKWFGSGLLGKIGRLFWNPPSTEGSCYKWMKEEVGVDEIPGFSFVNHGPESHLSQMVIDKLRPHIQDDWRESETAHIAELGAGSGNLARTVRQLTDAHVQEFDLMRGSTYSDYRTVADVTDLQMVRTGQYRIAYSSFCLEYTGLDGFKEANRILAPGGKFVALVHHTKSSIYPTSFNPATWIMFSIPRFILSITPIRILLPKAIRNILESFVRQGDHLKRAAFKSKSDATAMLRSAGFADIEISDAYSPPIFFQKSNKMLNSGWLITATKPKGKK